MKALFCLVVLLATAGCCSTKPVHPVTQFRHKHPKDFGEYVYINPVSLETYYFLQGQQYSAVKSIVVAAEKKYGDVSGLDEYLKTLEHSSVSDPFLNVENYKDLDAASAGGGTICQFGWSNGRSYEIGMLVLKDGDIIKRDVWSTDYNSKNFPKKK